MAVRCAQADGLRLTAQVYDDVEARDPAQPEFHQAVRAVLAPGRRYG